MNRTILLIEDNEQNLYLTTFLLEKSGFAVVAARDGPAGIELVQGADDVGGTYAVTVAVRRDVIRDLFTAKMPSARIGLRHAGWDFERARAPAPRDSSHLSAFRAAMQPKAAAVIAWRYS